MTNFFHNLYIATAVGMTLFVGRAWWIALQGDRTMEDLKLGQIITGDQFRDAIHIAVAPVVAAYNLSPATHIGLDSEGKASVNAKKIGVVDPFLKNDVTEGQRFWMFLYPNTVTSLRHHWTHPAFTAQEGVDPRMSHSEIWLRAYAMNLKPYETPDEAYRNLIEELRNNELSGHGTDLHSLSDVDDRHELEQHAAIVLGAPIDLSKFSFSCSC
jgi:hypothetical protein